MFASLRARRRGFVGQTCFERADERRSPLVHFAEQQSTCTGNTSLFARYRIRQFDEAYYSRVYWFSTQFPVPGPTMASRNPS